MPTMPDCLGKVGGYPRVSTFWGYITYEGVGTLVPVDGNINSQNICRFWTHICCQLLQNVSGISRLYSRMTMHRHTVESLHKTGKLKMKFLE